jgi:hypothetical protein
MEYRITRPERYGPSSPGHRELDARQGHFVQAKNPNAAKAWFRKRHKISPDEVLDVQDWNHGHEHGKIARSRDAKTPVTTTDDSAFIRTALIIKTSEHGSVDVLDGEGKRVAQVNIFLSDEALIVDVIDVEGIWPERRALTFRSPTNREHIENAGTIVSADFRKPDVAAKAASEKTS